MLAHGPLPMCSSLCGLSADRAFHKKVLFPKFRKYYAAELVLTILFFRERNLRTYSEAANGATAGYYFTNQQHTDEDDGYTLLSAIGQPSGGGEFYHADVGRAHVVCAGDILFVNPQARHGTAEFRIKQGDAMRVMFAFLRIVSFCSCQMTEHSPCPEPCGVPPACRRRAAVDEPSPPALTVL